MSKPAGNGEQPERAAFTELEAAVGTVLEQLADVTARAEGAESRSAEAEELLKRFTGDEPEAGRLLTRLKRLQDEKEKLLDEMARIANQGAERIGLDIRMSAVDFDIDVTRADEAERQMVIERNKAFKEAHSGEAEAGLARLKQVAREGGNLFEVMMEIVEHCTVGQVTQALFETGGKFRRNM